jgi:subtilase family protein
MLSVRLLGRAGLRGLRHRVGVPAVLLGVGILSLATTQGWAASRILPEDAVSAWDEAAGQSDLPLRAGTPQLGLMRLASKMPALHVAPVSQPLPKPQPREAAKPTLNHPEPKQPQPQPQDAAKRPQNPELKPQQQQNVAKPLLKDADPKQTHQHQDAAKPSPKVLESKQPQGPAKDLPRTPEVKPQDTAKSSREVIDPKKRLQDEAKRLEKEPKQHEAAKESPKDSAKHQKQDIAKGEAKDSGKPHKQETAKEDAKDGGKTHKQETAKEESKDAAKHHKQETAKEEAKDATKPHKEEHAKAEAKDAAKHHKEEHAKAEAKDAAKHHKQETAKEESKDAANHRKHETAKEEAKDAANHHHKQETAKAVVTTPTPVPQVQAIQVQPTTTKLAQPVPAASTASTPGTSQLAPAMISTPTPTPTAPQTDTTATAEAKDATDIKPTSTDTAQQLGPADTKVADAPSASSAMPFDKPYGLGGPTQSANPTDDKLPKGPADAKRLTDDRAQTKKPGERSGGVLGLGSHLPPPSESYRQGEFLVSDPSPKFRQEMQKRGYVVAPGGSSGLMHVTLTPDAPSAWEVQRELVAKFPVERLGLNLIYKPYHPQDGSKPTSPPVRREELLKLIGWGDGLGSCALRMKVGMIDTWVEKKSHPTFEDTDLESVNMALKQDAPPAPHWHATGVLSVMAGLPKSGTPALIPGARFTAVNVFFTNKDGQLETDTAHMTEALAYLDEQKGVQIVNMSLAGPQDPLVHDRIIHMARKGVVFVAAAGNGGPGAAPSYPAAYEQVIAVTAVDRKGGNYDHANRGAYIDVAAPGVQVRIALPDGKEGAQSGTSFAAPFVTALAAVAYRDSGLDAAVQKGRTSIDPKNMMLPQLVGTNELKKRDAVYGYGLIKAPERCGDQRWLSTVTALPRGRAPAAPVAFGDWTSAVMPASVLSGVSGR